MGDVTPKGEPVTPARKRGRTPSVPIKREAKKPKTTKTSTAAEGTSTTVPWSELPFPEEEPGPDLEGTLQRTLRRLRTTPHVKLTPRDLRQLRPAKGWTGRDPSGKKKKEARKKASESSPFDSIAKKLSFQ